MAGSTAQPGPQAVPTVTAVPSVGPLAYGQDPLTGLRSRQAFYDTVLRDDRLASAFVGVVCATISRFKRINDLWGQDYGDTCLIDVADWLRKGSAPGDLVARVSGNEFIVLYTAASKIVDLVSGANGESSTPEKVHTGVSVIGGWSPRRQNQPLLQVVKQAETALAVARRRSWRAVVEWDAAISATAAAELASEETVRKAVSGDRLAVRFQPVVDLVARRVVSVEALARLKAPDDQVAAERIVELSRRLGLGLTFATAIFKLAFSEGHLLDPVMPGAQIAVNVSRELLGGGDAIDVVADAATAAGVALSDVIVELTEDVADGVSLRALEDATLHGLDLGMQVVIDDFGTGETSLSLLRSLPVSAIKLDRSLLPGERGPRWVALHRRNHRDVAGTQPEPDRRGSRDRRAVTSVARTRHKYPAGLPVRTSPGVLALADESGVPALATTAC